MRGGGGMAVIPVTIALKAIGSGERSGGSRSWMSPAAWRKEAERGSVESHSTRVQSWQGGWDLLVQCCFSASSQKDSQSPASSRQCVRSLWSSATHERAVSFTSSIHRARLSLRLSMIVKPLAKDAENGNIKKRSSKHQA